MFNLVGNFIGDIVSEFKHQNSETYVEAAVKVTEGTLLAGICAYGGTYFFTRYHPLVGASYIGIVALASQIAYRALEGLKENVDTPFFQHTINVIQLLQIPFFCYLFNGQGVSSAAPKMEIITATAHFVAIPIFIHLAIIAWNDPTVEHIGATMAVMLPLASRLQTYAELFK